MARATLPHGLPLGVVVLGLAFGLLNALGAVALILVYRAGGYVNFAQASFGAVGAALAYELTTGYHWKWILAVLVGLLASVALAVLSEILFVQRLFTTPRLILTVATIGIAQFAATVGLLVGKLKSTVGLAPDVKPPFHLSFRIGLILFDSSAILVFIVAPVALGALALFLTRSRYGSVAQAAAENADRARLLGVSVRSLSTVTWALVGALSGIAAILETPLVGTAASSTAFGPTLLLRALAPAMIVGLRSMPLAVAAALVLGVVEEALSYSVNIAGPVDLTLFLVILAALLLRRRGQSRTTEGEERSFALSSVVRPVPRRLLREARLRAGGLGIVLAGLTGAVVLPLFLDLGNQSLATAVVCYALAAISLTVLSGYGGQVSFGQWAFVGFGALFGGALVTRYDLPFLAGLIVVPLAGAGVAVVVGLPALRIRGIFLGVTTLAFAIAANAYIFNWGFFRNTYIQRTTVLGVDLGNQRVYYWFCVAVLVVCMLGVRNIRRSVLGRELLAVRDNDRAAASYGVGLVRVRLWAFAISGFLASLAGYLYLFNIGSANAQTFQPLTSLLLFSAVIIGGLGSQVGAVIGTIYFKGVQYFLPQWAQLFSTSFGLLLILLFVPGGLSSILFGARDAFLRRYALARGIRVGGIVGLRRKDADEAPQVAAAATLEAERS
ncbi:MAG TPA: ABC transporter permease [Gaiellaceae bacterium]|nr:ABC transporter permease [Gaiellaceae bacterium]